MEQRKTFSRAARDAVRGMRVHQWLKNLLIFVPAATAHRILDPAVFTRVFLAFFSFSVCASAGYLVNDLMDLKVDRLHPTKRLRPFARGALSPMFGIALASLLLLTALGFGNLVSRRYVLFLCGYLALTVAYSLTLKTMLLVDIFLLAFFYTFRILLGGEAAGVTVSFWLAAFSTFFFFSLAVVKRFIELRLLLGREDAASARRNYRMEDLSMLGMWGTASGCASVVVLSLYINSEDVTRLYRHPVLLWPVCLAILFWLSRVWMLANRDELPYDPIVFALGDRQSYIVAALVAVAFFLAL
jgi:4-hydroxybenzoate polyprenyltransferase